MSTPVMPEPFTSYSLRVLVLFHGAVAIDRLVPPGRAPIALDDDSLGLGVPPIEGASRAPTLRWVGPTELRVTMPDGEQVIRLDAPFSYSAGPVEVTLSVVRHFRVTPWSLGVDPLFASALVSMVALALVVQGLIGTFGVAARPLALQASPELIARLLQQDFDGADQGDPYKDMVRPEAQIRAEDLYLPAGDRGPLDQLGGSEAPPPELLASADKSQGSGSLRGSRAADPRRLELHDVAWAPGTEEFADLGDSQRPGSNGASSALTQSKRQGFGLKDWYDQSDERDRDAIKQRLEDSRDRVKLNPNSLGALRQLAYYQYLAEDYEGCRRTYNRVIELDPDSAAGYNNLALVYKRQGEFTKEEGFYRLALSLEPDNVHALNNLAVNLAHQGRHQEAWAIMERLADLDPGDPYADLHRAKLMAARGRDDEALRYLELALQGADQLDTFHHIEFRQDIRVDPAFSRLRKEDRFYALLSRYYADRGADLTPGGHDG